MDFDLNDDQLLLSRSVERFLGENYSFEKRRRYLAEGPGWSREIWAQFAQLGVLGLPFDEADGGFGGDPASLMLVMEAFGRELVMEPFLTSVVLAGTALRSAGSKDQRSDLLPAVAQGNTILAWAHAEPGARHETQAVSACAKRKNGQWTICGIKILVLQGDSADVFVVSARVDGGDNDPDGIGLFLVDATARGVTRRAVKLSDDTRTAEIRFSDAAAEPLGTAAEGADIIERVTEAGIIATAAEAVGVMEKAHALTLSYLKSRQQFGKPIGSNQVLQHRAAEMLVALEQSRSMAMLATIASSQEDRAERRRELARVKAIIGRNGRFVGQQAVQLHGAMGMTEEYPVGHYFRRLTVLDQMFGDSSHHLASLGRRWLEPAAQHVEGSPPARDGL